MLATSNPRTLSYALKESAGVMSAVVLRDLRTRFFNHGLGFLVVAIWPLLHMFSLLIIYNLTGRTAPYGESLNLFFATGLIPTLLFMYVSRFMSLSLLMNRPMLDFPVVKPIDILIGRAFLESTAAMITMALMAGTLIFLGDDPFPTDWLQAGLCYISILSFSVGMGIMVGVVSVFYPFFNTIYALLMIVIYGTSGTMFVASELPSQVGELLSYSPIVQSVEWMRSAYYPSYSDRLLDKQYMVSAAIFALFLGFFAERVSRKLVYEG